MDQFKAPCLMGFHMWKDSGNSYDLAHEVVRLLTVWGHPIRTASLEASPAREGAIRLTLDLFVHEAVVDVATKGSGTADVTLRVDGRLIPWEVTDTETQTLAAHCSRLIETEADLKPAVTCVSLCAPDFGSGARPACRRNRLRTYDR
ncbi:hypothetical protein OG948_59445 (plasmid) [Embleya sp. NBC_00888]|uniref:hypothetical protein n=1 Tax=Embleya sp. NBC_00888 TaxID=2975960 RepID=UPI00387031BA|nr:hypothetical protein OG948_59445 [Embleya sp. NBC_00888]